MRHDGAHALEHDVGAYGDAGPDDREEEDEALVLFVELEDDLDGRDGGEHGERDEDHQHGREGVDRLPEALRPLARREVLPVDILRLRRRLDHGAAAAGLRTLQAAVAWPLCLAPAEEERGDALRRCALGCVLWAMRLGRVLWAMRYALRAL